MEELKDIKAIENIQIDFLPYILIAFGVVFFIGLIIYYLLRKKKKPTQKELAKKVLKALDFENLEDKKLAYTFTSYGYICLEKHFEDEFLKIVRQLEPFKYKKEVQQIDSDLKSQMKDFIKVRL